MRLQEQSDIRALPAELAQSESDEPEIEILNKHRDSDRRDSLNLGYTELELAAAVVISNPIRNLIFSKAMDIFLS